MFTPVSSGLPAAVKSDQTTGTSTAVAVTPAVQQNHASASKAWVNFDGKTGAVATVKSSFNVTSVVRNSLGNYTITFTTAFANASYAIAGCGVDPGAHIGLIYLNGTIAAGSITFSLWDISNAVFFDGLIVCLEFHGVQ